MTAKKKADVKKSKKKSLKKAIKKKTTKKPSKTKPSAKKAQSSVKNKKIKNSIKNKKNVKKSINKSAKKKPHQPIKKKTEETQSDENIQILPPVVEKVDLSEEDIDLSESFGDELISSDLSDEDSLFEDHEDL